jgi:squalene cyclase
MTGARGNSVGRAPRVALALFWCAPALAGTAQNPPAPALNHAAAQSAAAGSTLGVPPQLPAGITPAVHESIQKGLKVLVSLQNRDGSWRSEGSSGGYPTAMTALAGLALLAGGNTPTQGTYAENVSHGLSYLLGTARRDGLIASVEEESHCMHGHGFAMLFLAECYGMEEDAQRRGQVGLALQRAVQLTARSQSAAGGWLYTPDSSGDEGSVTVTQVQALRACRNVGIAVPKRTIDQAMLYLERSVNADGGIRYQVSDHGPSRPAITAAAVACWYNAGLYDSPRVAAALRFVKPRLTPDPTDTVQSFGHYFYGHLYLSQVMYQTSERDWQEYFSAMRDALVHSQERDGSWEGDAVGPVYGTSVALIILQLPYKNLPIMQR